VYSVHLRRFRRTTNPFVMAGQVKALYQGSRVISDICDKRNIDVVHANNDSAALIGWEVARVAKVPFVWHCRDLIPMHGFARILSGAASAVVAISKTVEQHLIKEGVNPQKVRRIENGIDFGRIVRPDHSGDVRKRIRAELGIGARQPVVLCVGAYVPWKKLDVFIDTVAALRSRIPDAIGLLAGSGQLSQNEVYEDVLRGRAEGWKLDSSALRFLGERDDVPDVMAAADILISCSESEPFGRVMAEAGAAGLPVVANRSGGAKEIVEHGVTGLLAEPGDREALVGACVRLLDDEKLRGEFGAAARVRVHKLFDVQRTAGELASLFESIVKRPEAKSLIR
jgi:glycosyltransferase involved in cell wall biosynthesis